MSVAIAASTAESWSERTARFLDRIDYRLIATDEDREAIFRLRYDAYLREGTITPNFGKRVSDKYDDLDNSWIFAVLVDGALASSIRLTVGAPEHPDIPAMGVFSDILEPLIASGKVLIDPTRFVADNSMTRAFPELPYATLRLGWMAGAYFHPDLILATVRAEHQAFYKRIFGQRPVCEPRSYPGLTKPISLMSLDYAAGKANVERRYPFFRSTHFERRMLFQGVDDAPGQLRLPEAVEDDRGAA